MFTRLTNILHSNGSSFMFIVGSGCPIATNAYLVSGRPLAKYCFILPIQWITFKDNKFKYNLYYYFTTVPCSKLNFFQSCLLQPQINNKKRSSCRWGNVCPSSEFQIWLFRFLRSWASPCRYLAHLKVMLPFHLVLCCCFKAMSFAGFLF